MLLFLLMVQSEREKYFKLLPNWMNPDKYVPPEKKEIDSEENA